MTPTGHQKPLTHPHTHSHSLSLSLSLILSLSLSLSLPHPDDTHWSSKTSNPATGPIGSNNNELLGEVAGADVIIIDDIVGEFKLV